MHDQAQLWVKILIQPFLEYQAFCLALWRHQSTSVGDQPSPHGKPFHPRRALHRVTQLKLVLHYRLFLMKSKLWRHLLQVYERRQTRFLRSTLWQLPFYRKAPIFTFLKRNSIELYYYLQYSASESHYLCWVWCIHQKTLHGFNIDLMTNFIYHENHWCLLGQWYLVRLLVLDRIVELVVW